MQVPDFCGISQGEMQCTHGSLETFKTETRATDYTSVFPSQCCCWKHFGWMVVISPPRISSSLLAGSQWAFQPEPPTWASGRIVTEQRVQPFNFIFLTGWIHFKNRKTCKEEKEREKWAQLTSLLSLYRVVIVHHFQVPKPCFQS